MDYKQLIIRGISYSQTQSGAYALLLEHEETHIKLPVVIGNFEAQSISLGLEKDIHAHFVNFKKRHSVVKRTWVFYTGYRTNMNDCVA